jgi:hypothetical protein
LAQLIIKVLFYNIAQWKQGWEGCHVAHDPVWLFSLEAEDSLTSPNADGILEWKQFKASQNSKS